MTSNLSHKFYGDKKFKQTHYALLQEQGSLPPDLLSSIFQPYSAKLRPINAGDTSLLDLFNEFLLSVLSEFIGLPFAKLSTVVEICAHVFEHSFEQWLTREESHAYLSEVVVRHSLFRPPHSVHVLDYDDLTALGKWWREHFHAYYDEYSHCFMSRLNRVLTTCAPLAHPRPHPSLQGSTPLPAQDIPPIFK